MTTGDKEASLTAVVRDWSSAGDWCQERCMDLVSIETEEEWSLIRNKMEAAGAKFIWTSGHKCDRDVGQRQVFNTVSEWVLWKLLYPCFPVSAYQAYHFLVFLETVLPRACASKE